MNVKFKFDYVLNFHNKHSYITAIDRDGVAEEIAFQRSIVQINRFDINSITKLSDGTANIIMKNTGVSLETVEQYNDIIETIQKANVALKIMQQEKVYIFDSFEVDSDELNVVNEWETLGKNCIYENK
jgi:hypothetical protein